MRIHKRVGSDTGVRGTDRGRRRHGTARAQGEPDVMYRRQHHRGRTAFIVVLTLCWALGLIGLDVGRSASIKVVVLAGFALLAGWAISGRRRRLLDTRLDVPPSPRVMSRNCVVIRPLGSDEHPAGRG